MSIPGGNIMAMASRAIAQQSFVYFPYVTRTLMGNGLWSATYAAGQPMSGSAQPVPRNLYANQGLDFQRLYYNFLSSKGSSTLRVMFLEISSFSMARIFRRFQKHRGLASMDGSKCSASMCRIIKE